MILEKERVLVWLRAEALLQKWVLERPREDAVA